MNAATIRQLLIYGEDDRAEKIEEWFDDYGDTLADLIDAAEELMGYYRALGVPVRFQPLDAVLARLAGEKETRPSGLLSEDHSEIELVDARNRDIWHEKPKQQYTRKDYERDKAAREKRA